MSSSRWTIARHRLAGDVPATVFLWLIFAVIVAAVGVAMAGLGAVTGSVWEPAARIPRWFAAAVGASLTWSSLPVYLAHGYTRREFAMQMPVFIVGFAAALAVLMTIGFAIETLVFRAAGLPSALSTPHLFTSPGQLPLVFVEFLLLLPVWTVAGALLGAAFARNTGLGALLIPAALVMVTMPEFAAGPGNLAPPVFGLAPLMARSLAVFGRPDPSLTAALVACVGVVALGMAGVWALIRDIPVRTPTP
jgi:hypothetical protein